MVEKEISEFRERILSLESELQTLKLKFENSLKKENLKIDSPSPQKATSPKDQKSVSKNIDSNVQNGTTSFENFQNWITENLFVKLGVLSILSVSVWFFTLAIESYWINESVRIWLGILLGFPVSIYGLKIRESKPYLSPSLIGLGTSVSFVAYFIGYLVYDLYPADVCFVGLFLMCLLTVGVAHILNNEIVFGFGAIGALLVPLLLSTGQNSYPFLFSYLFVWNLLFVFLFKNKNWKISILLLIFGNHLLFFGWAFDHLEEAKPFFPIFYFISTTSFFLYKEFFTLNKFFGSKNALNVITIGFILLFGFIEGYWIFSIFYPKFLASLLILFLIVFYLFYKQGLVSTKITAEKKEIYDIIGLLGLPLIVTCLVLGMEGKFLAFGLFGFSFLTTISSAKSDQKLLYFLNLFVWLYTLSYAFLFVYPDSSEIFILNGRMALFIVGALFLFLSYHYTKGFSELSKLFLYISYPYFLIGNMIEINLHFPHEQSLFLYSISLVFYGILLLGFGFWKENHFAKKIGFFTLSLVILKFYLYDIWNLGLLFRILAGLVLGTTLILIGTISNRKKKKESA